MRPRRRETVPAPAFPHRLPSLLVVAERVIVCAVLAGCATLRLPRYCGCADHHGEAHHEHRDGDACALRCLGQRWLKILWKNVANKDILQRSLASTEPGETWLMGLAPQECITQASRLLPAF
jgi:hypothetical protein